LVKNDIARISVFEATVLEKWWLSRAAVV